jgi:hypothetical protein
MGERKVQEHVEQFQRPGVPIRISRLIGVKPLDAESDTRDQGISS